MTPTRFPTPRQTRVALITLVPLATLVGAAFGPVLLARADYIPAPFTSGQTLTAASLTAEFDKIKAVVNNPGARYSSGSSQFITNDSSFHTVEFSTKDYDTQNSFSTGSDCHFTAPVAGRYLVAISIRGGCSSGNACDGTQVNLRMVYGPTEKVENLAVTKSWYGGNASLAGTQIVYLAAGDEVRGQLQSSPAAGNNFVSGGSVFAIQRVGD